MLLTEPLLSCPCCVFGVIVMLKTQPRPIFNVLTDTEGRRLLAKISRYMAPPILPSIRCSRPVPFAEKHPQSMMFPPPCFTVGMVFLGLSSFFFFLRKNGEWSLYQKVLFWSHLTTCPYPMPPLDHPDGNLQTGLDMCWLEQGNLAHAAGF